MRQGKEIQAPDIALAGMTRQGPRGKVFAGVGVTSQRDFDLLWTDEGDRRRFAIEPNARPESAIR
jgi:hypothetical protein